MSSSNGSVQRAPSKRWVSSMSKNIYDDWGDEDDDFAEEDEGEEEEELVSPTIAHKSPERTPSEIKDRLQLERDLSIDRPDLGVENSPKQLRSNFTGGSTESVIITKKSLEPVLVVETTANQKFSKDSDIFVDTADISSDSMEQFKQKSEVEHLERQHNLHTMESLYKRISRQISNTNDDEDDFNKVSDDDSFSDYDSNLNDPDDEVMEGLHLGTSNPSFEKERPTSNTERPVSANSENGIDKSKLDKNFEDLFEDFENLSFSTNNTPKVEVGNNLANKQIESPISLKSLPLVEKYDQPVSTDKVIPLEIKESDEVKKLNLNTTGSSSIESQVSAKEVSKVQESRLKASVNNDDSTDDYDDNSIADSASFDEMIVEKLVIPKKSNTLPSTPVVEIPVVDTPPTVKKEQSGFPEIESKPEPADYYSDDSDQENDVFRASQGVWSAPKSIAVPVSNEKSFDDSIADSDKFNNSFDYNESIEASDLKDLKTFNTTNEFKIAEKVFGDNFPSGDNESIYTDNYSEFRTSIYKNDFIKRAQQAHEHEKFDVAALSEIARLATEKDNKVLSARDILKDDESLAESLTKENQERPGSSSFANEYLQMSDGDTTSEDESNTFKTSMGVWKPDILQSNQQSQSELPKIKEEERTQILPEVFVENIYKPSDVPRKTSEETKPKEVSSLNDAISGMVAKQKSGNTTPVENKRNSELISIKNISSSSLNRSASDVSTKNKDRIATTTPLVTTVSNFDESHVPPLPQTPVKNDPIGGFSFETPPKQDSSPVVPPKDPSIFSPGKYRPIQTNMKQIFSHHHGEQMHDLLRKVREDEYLHDSGLQLWLESTLKTTTKLPQLSAKDIGPHAKEAYAIVQQHNTASYPAGVGRRMSINSKINIGSHRLLKGTKNVKGNFKGGLEKGLARGLFKKKK